MDRRAIRHFQAIAPSRPAFPGQNQLTKVRVKYGKFVRFSSSWFNEWFFFSARVNSALTTPTNSELHKVLLVGSSDKSKAPSELLSISEEKEVANITAFPMHLVGPQGQTVNDSPVICGGYNAITRRIRLAKGISIASHLIYKKKLII